MAIKTILTEPNKLLRQVSQPVDQVGKYEQKLMDDMLETMYQGSGIGLAATQVNVHKRVIVLDISESKDEPLILINPEIKKIIDPNKKIFSEGCLSVPGFYEELKRPGSVEISYLDIDGGRKLLLANDLLAVVIQHEMDHLDGKMMVDFISNIKREMIRKKLLKAKGG